MYAGAHFRAVAARTQEWITRSRDALHLLVAERGDIRLYRDIYLLENRRRESRPVSCATQAPTPAGSSGHPGRRPQLQ